MSSQQNIEVETKTLPAGILLKPKGDIDLSRAPAFRTEIAKGIQKANGAVFIDLNDVPYMDSSGVATLVEALKTTSQSGNRLVLFGMQERVRSIFEIARLDTVFKITETLEQAQED
ncbi:MAG: anti-anti-sigma factor [Phycisphaerae bacterium]|nr:anti-anti-sigma factor [Phycisphaerae bacterium]HAW95627.1 anti-anti-sigma factor [Phycisphaerales bacterium]|tara:strand:+ start:1468 stop:1815 length:348 start_codon:yes stop_codon:yes gene_type:complete